MSKLSATGSDSGYDYSGVALCYNLHQEALLSLYTQLALLFNQNAEVHVDMNRSSGSVYFVILQQQTGYLG